MNTMYSFVHYSTSNEVVLKKNKPIVFTILYNNLDVCMGKEAMRIHLDSFDHVT